MRNVLLPLATVALACLQYGCATIVKGTHQEVPVASEPLGASVSVNGVREGSTPTTLRLARKQSHVITLEKDGYEAESVTLKPSIGGAVAGNIIAGGLIGWGVDASTGAQYNLFPDSVNLRLRKVAVAQPQTVAVRPSESKMGSLLEELAALDSLKKEGKLSQEEYGKLRESTLSRYQN